MSETSRTPWRRPRLAATGPARNAGGYYRTSGGAAGQVPGSGEGPPPKGVPLSQAEDAVVAAVRLAYDVAATQLDRSDRMARRLRDAADLAVGGNSDTQALDAAEKLVMRSVMSGLEWWETLVAQGRCPVKRLMQAEYQMIGTVLGFKPLHPPPHPAPPPRAAPPRSEAAPARKISIKHKAQGAEVRPITIEKFEVEGCGTFENVYLHHVGDPASVDPITVAVVLAADGSATLSLTTSRALASGAWAGAVCDENGVQCGIVAIRL